MIRPGICGAWISAVWLLAFSSAPSAFALGYGAWTHRAEVAAPAERIVAVPLPEALLGVCASPQLPDLRLADAAGDEVPFAIVRDEETRREVTLDGVILNRESPSPRASRLTVDFGKPVLKNSVVVVTGGDDFRRRAHVEGSADQASWSVILSAGWLHAVRSGGRFETLVLGDNTYRFLRVTVEAMPEEATAPSIQSITCRHVVVESPVERELAGTVDSYTQEAGESIALVSFPYGNLPISRLRLGLSSDPQRTFQRPCQVFGRSSLTQTVEIRFETNEVGEGRTVETPWSSLGAGQLSRDAAGAQSLDILVQAPYRYLRIVIENGDSPPLPLGSVTAFLRDVYLVFEPAGQSSFTVYAGNAESPAPRYEAQRTLSGVTARKLPRGQVGEVIGRAATPDGAPLPGQTAVWWVMGATVAASLLLLWRTAAKVGAVEGAEVWEDVRSGPQVETQAENRSEKEVEARSETQAQGRAAGGEARGQGGAPRQGLDPGAGSAVDMSADGGGSEGAGSSGGSPGGSSRGSSGESPAQGEAPPR